ncbi:MAG: hypothetical protein R3F43_12420 [bacterium]
MIAQRGGHDVDAWACPSTVPTWWAPWWSSRPSSSWGRAAWASGWPTGGAGPRPPSRYAPPGRRPP